MPVIPSEASLDLNPIKDEVRQYVTLKDEITTLEARVKTLKARITKAVDTFGEANDKGHVVLHLGDEQTAQAIVKQRRVSKVFDETVANTILSERNLTETCTKTVTVLDQDAVMAAYYDGILSDDDINQMFPEKITWALTLEK